MKIKPCANRSLLDPCTLEGRNSQVDPYIGCEHYCYYCYALNQAETDWRKEVLIRKDITSQLESELAGIAPRPYTWTGKPIRINLVRRNTDKHTRYLSCCWKKDL